MGRQGRSPWLLGLNGTAVWSDAPIVGEFKCEYLKHLNNQKPATQTK